MSVDTIIEATIGKEGGYANNPNDPGGETMWGITKRVAVANGYTGGMRQLPRDRATAIYRAEYFEKPGFAAVAQISARVAEELFDTGVNMGPAVPGTWFQEILNAMNDGGSLYSDIVVDMGKPGGGIGPKTLAAFRSYLAKRGGDAETVMIRALNCRQGSRYLDLAQARVANEDFVFGWLKARVA